MLKTFVEFNGKFSAAKIRLILPVKLAIGIETIDPLFDKDASRKIIFN